MYEKKKYCIFAAQFLPHMGGVERYTYNLSKKLIEKGNEVVVVTSNLYQLARQEVVDGILVYRVPCINLLDGRYPVLKPNKEFREIRKQLMQQEFDMVIVNTRFYLHSLYGMMFAKRRKVRCITIEHGSSHLSVHNPVLDAVGGVFEHMLTGVGKWFCKEYYGVSGACNEWLEHFHIRAKGILYNSIDLEEIAQVAEKPAAHYREQFQIPQDAIVITFTGRLLKEKGLPQLLHVMEQILKDREDVYLFIAGDGDMEEEVGRRKSEHIIPLGRIDFQHIVALLNETDIFCLPSFSEGFSTSILEAVACKCYILTTARGGAKELLIDEAYGTIIPNNQEEILYDAMQKVLDDKAHREQACQLAYQRLKACFTWDIVAAQVEEIYERQK